MNFDGSAILIWAVALFPFFVTTGLFVLWKMGVETPQIKVIKDGKRTEIVWGQVKRASK